MGKIVVMPDGTERYLELEGDREKFGPFVKKSPDFKRLKRKKDEKLFSAPKEVKVQKAELKKKLKFRKVSSTVIVQITKGGQGQRSHTTISVSRNIVCLWLLLMGRENTPNISILLRNFVETVCLPRWPLRESGHFRGLGVYVEKCMIHAMLNRKDYLVFRRLYLSKFVRC
jgi:hypothetical protein